MTIKVLPHTVAERIAAGEVIERPASSVKELVENALDAQATEISVHLEDGGKILIEVIDNGTGMAPEDLKLCVQRHATSKLSELEDLEKITTLGFRGEALPSIAAVSHLTLISKTRDDPTAFKLSATPHGIFELEPTVFGHFLGSPHGTCVRAENLFSQIPARLKFLKSKGSEMSSIREWLERLALSHSHVGFKLLSDGKNYLNLRPENLISRIKTVLSDGEDFPIQEMTSQSEHLKVHLYWLQGMSSPQTRKLIQIVNKRVLKDRLLQQAILIGFRQALMPGQFPAVVLSLEINPSLIDVNVHPTKTEVRFLNSRVIFHEIEKTVQKLLSEKGNPALVRPAPFSAHEQSFSGSSFYQVPFQPQPHFQAELPAQTLDLPLEGDHPFSQHSFVGILFNTYLVFQLGEELGLIDQHAAHERIRYEKIQEFFKQPHAQAKQVLMLPEAIKFPLEEKSIIESRLPSLTALGFEVEIFGEDVLLVRAVPAPWGIDSLRIRLKNLVEKLIAHSHELLMDETLFEAIASEACHSAIRAGDTLEKGEALQLVKSLFLCKHPWNCPHGRPTVVKVPKTKLEEWFLRKV